MPDCETWLGSAEGLLRADGKGGWEERHGIGDLHMSYRIYGHRMSYARRFCEPRRYITATHLGLSVADRCGVSGRSALISHLESKFYVIIGNPRVTINMIEDSARAFLPMTFAAIWAQASATCIRNITAHGAHAYKAETNAQSLLHERHSEESRTTSQTATKFREGRR